MDDTDWSADGTDEWSDDSVGGTRERSDRSTSAQSGWELVAEHDGAAAVIDVVLELDEDETLARSELCEAAAVPYKTLYLADTLNALADLGILETHEGDDGETTFAAARESDVFQAAAAFAAATDPRSPVESA